MRSRSRIQSAAASQALEGGAADGRRRRRPPAGHPRSISQSRPASASVERSPGRRPPRTTTVSARSSRTAAPRARAGPRTPATDPRRTAPRRAPGSRPRVLDAARVVVVRGSPHRDGEAVRAAATRSARSASAVATGWRRTNGTDTDASNAPLEGRTCGVSRHERHERIRTHTLATEPATTAVDR